MAQVSPSLRRVVNGYAHWCPGCREMHVIPDGWTFNGDVNRPSFSPSVKISGGHYVPGHQGDCWCTFKERTGRESAFKCGVCHYFLQDGALRYCGDSTHGLAGKTVPLPELPPEHRDAPS